MGKRERGTAKGLFYWGLKGFGGAAGRSVIGPHHAGRSVIGPCHAGRSVIGPYRAAVEGRAAGGGLWD